MRFGLLEVGLGKSMGFFASGVERCVLKDGFAMLSCGHERPR